MTPLTITITENAAKHVRDFTGRDSEENVSLRVGVKGGGCSGLTYDLSIDTEFLETDKVIEEINSGVSIINYIGHGTSSLLADEHILTISDIDRIFIPSNKLPIWVVGTCSFGDYINDSCLGLRRGNSRHC